VRHDDFYIRYEDTGIPVAEYGYQEGVYVGPQTTPRIVGNAAIMYYTQYEGGNTSALIPFKNTIDWLMENATIEDVQTDNGTKTIGHWYFDFDIWSLRTGWYQSMADARAIYALSLAYDIYANSSYLDVCDAVITSFEVATSEGGNLYKLEDGTHWYPEYIVPLDIDPNYEPWLILNGFLFALRNLYRANLVLNNTRLTTVFELGIISAADNLHLYDSPNGWSLYHLAYPQKLASTMYHNIHIGLCEELYEYTNVTEFDTYAKKWAGYTSRPFITLEEILSPEFIYFGFVMLAIILVPTIAIDFVQWKVRSYLKKRNSSGE